MGKLIKTYWSKDRKVRIDVFENRNRNKSSYHIFKIWFYFHERPQPVCFKKNEVHSLQEVLSLIKIKGYDKEPSQEK